MTRIGAPLTERQLQILLAVVQEHVQTREPVGSLVVHRAYGVAASPATIRHEMVQLERAGYLYQPHTSAGRVPRDAAYRVYVNYLAARPLPEPPAARWIEGEYRRLTGEPHQLARHTSRLLARVTAHPAVTTLPASQEPLIERLRLQPVSATNVLLSYVLSDGQKREHLLTTSTPMTAAQLAVLSEALERFAVGREVSRLAGLTAPQLRPFLPSELPWPESLLAAIAQAAAADDTTDIFVEGTSYILDEPEFGERERLRAFMRALDEEVLLRCLLHTALESPGTSVTIGREHPVAAQAECSLVACPYAYGSRRGVVGIFGPLRMDYPTAMAAASFIARKLTETLAERE